MYVCMHDIAYTKSPHGRMYFHSDAHALLQLTWAPRIFPKPCAWKSKLHRHGMYSVCVCVGLESTNLSTPPEHDRASLSRHMPWIARPVCNLCQSIGWTDTTSQLVACLAAVCCHHTLECFGSTWPWWLLHLQTRIRGPRRAVHVLGLARFLRCPAVCPWCKNIFLFVSKPFRDPFVQPGLWIRFPCQYLWSDLHNDRLILLFKGN